MIASWLRSQGHSKPCSKIRTAFAGSVPCLTYLSIKPGGDSSRITMKFSPRILLMVGSLIAASSVPLYADGQQQKPNKLESGSTPAYDEHNTTSPASATSSSVARDNALKPAPGKV